MKLKTQLNIIMGAAWIIGFFLLAYSGNWKMCVAIFILLFANNLQSRIDRIN